MAADSQKLYAFEWVGAILWTVFWGTLACFTLAQKSITLGAGKFGLGAGHLEGTAAIAVGFVMLGAAAGGIGWLFRLNRQRGMLRLILFALWLVALVSYVLLASP